MYDAELYRDKAEVAEWMRKRDPIALYRAELRRRGWLDDAADLEVEHQVAAAVKRAVADAEEGAFEPVEDLELDVYTPRAS